VDNHFKLFALFISSDSQSFTPFGSLKPERASLPRRRSLYASLELNLGGTEPFESLGAGIRVADKVPVERATPRKTNAMSGRRKEHEFISPSTG
jgi:hypothetical protein